MNVFLIFEPLKNKKALKIGIISGVIIGLVYFVFSIFVSMLSIGFDAMPFFDLFSFGLIKSFSMFTIADWIVFALFPIIGGLVFANYEYWKCKSSKIAHTGLVGGLLAATCPACILPVLGLASATTAVFQLSWIIKISALVLLLASTYLIAYKQQKCVIDKNNSISANNKSKS